MNLGIPIWKSGSPFLYGDPTHMDPRYHTGFLIWERGHRFHMGIWHKWIPITIRGSRYGDRDRHIPIWKWLITVSIWGLRICGSPFLQGKLQQPQTVVRAGKRVNYAPTIATGTASYAKIPIPINHLVKGSIVVTWNVLLISIWGSPYEFGDPHM